MKKNIVIIVMAIVIAVMGLCLVITNNKLDNCEKEITAMDIANESLNKELARVQNIAGDLFEENLDYMNREEALNTLLDDANARAETWENRYHGAYSNKDCEDYQNHSGVSLTSNDSEYQKELEYNSKTNDWNN